MFTLCFFLNKILRSRFFFLWSTNSTTRTVILYRCYHSLYFLFVKVWDKKHRSDSTDPNPPALTAFKQPLDIYLSEREPRLTARPDEGGRSKTNLGVKREAVVDLQAYAPRRWHGELFARGHCNLSIIFAPSPSPPADTFGPACNHPLRTVLPLPTWCLWMKPPHPSPPLE